MTSLFEFLRRYARARRELISYDWSHVPRPNWACKRNYPDTW